MKSKPIIEREGMKAEIRLLKQSQDAQKYVIGTLRAEVAALKTRITSLEIELAHEMGKADLDRAEVAELEAKLDEERDRAWKAEQYIAKQAERLAAQRKVFRGLELDARKVLEAYPDAFRGTYCEDLARSLVRAREVLDKK